MTELGHIFNKVDWDRSEVLFECKQSPQFRIVWDDDCLVVLIRNGKKWATTAWLFPEARKALTLFIEVKNFEDAVNISTIVQVMLS